MALYKQSIDLLPKQTEEEIKEEFKLSKAGIYAAILPMFASLIWVIAVLINAQYKNISREVDSEITEKEVEISTYDDIRKKQTELILKVNELKELTVKDFYPQKYFNYVSSTISSTGDAEAEIYSYGREESGKFVIEGKANSYLDLAKIMVVFVGKEEFSNVIIESIHYNSEYDNVNFKISFFYSEESENSV